MPAVIDAIDEELIYFSEAKRVLPGQPAKQTIHNWYLHGRIGVSGERVKLQAVLMPRGLATTRRLFKEFIAALNAPAEGAACE